MLKTYRITESGFSYTYRSESESIAVWEWLAANFKAGCYVKSISRNGKFIVLSATDSTYHLPAQIREV